MDVYLFMLVGNQSGSTLLHNLFAQCENVVALNSDVERTTYEGFQWVKSSMPDIELNNHSYVWTEMEEAIGNPKNYKWDNVKKTWLDMWRTHKNFDNKDRVFLEKSPSDVGRGHLLAQEFPNSWFICQVRNPYVVAEGVCRRQQDGDIRRAARHAIKMLRIQKRNIETVPNLLAWRYEDIPEIPSVLEKLVNETIPCIDDFTFGREAYSTSLDGYQKKEFEDFNKRQLERIDERMIRIMNEEFKAHRAIMKFFNYDWMESND